MGLCSSVSSLAESARDPSTVSISHADAPASPGSAENAACDLRGERAARGALFFLGL